MRYLLPLLLIMMGSCKSQLIAPLTESSHSQLRSDVEIIVDQWGIPHIYADDQRDLFYAQGYHAAKERLFQFEVWRRQATGTVAEILGERELKRDIGTRLFLFRKDIETEMNHYHDDGAEIITAYVDGVNAYIKEILKTPKELPLEFKLLNLQPGLWTPEVVISRHQGLLGNIGNELSTARAIALIGEEKVRELMWFHPQSPDLRIDSTINAELLLDDILGLYNAYRRPVRFMPDDVDLSYRSDVQASDLGYEHHDLSTDPDFSIGSNNWAIDGSLTESGYPIMANDPHRTLAVPSLRYMSHLVAPGWNVIGGGEPEIPGISIGHNDQGAWGLTVFRSDAEDLYVYQTNPDNPNQYWHKNEWLNYTIIKETIKVKNAAPVEIELKYTIHGPVCYENTAASTAYAVRCGWLEYGGSPYLASLRMDQSQTFEEFREACNYSNIPGENMVWADRDGNIGWQVVGINPYRRTHSGMVPVPGDGRYEWDGYIEIKDRPHVYNPASGMIITANESVTPADYTEWDAIGYQWSDPHRGSRVKESLLSKKAHNIDEMVQLQTDYMALPARELIPLLTQIKTPDQEPLLWAQKSLSEWDMVLAPESRAAAIYVEWENAIKAGASDLAIPEQAKPYITTVQLTRILEWMTNPSYLFSGDEALRDEFLLKMLDQAMAQLTKRFGPNRDSWRYGSENFKHVKMIHPMSQAVNDSIRAILEVGPLPRGGYAYTVASTGSRDNQPSGGTFRVVMDTGDWDNSKANNSPGQSGNPEHPHYKNLFEQWAKDEYFPLLFSKEKIEAHVDYRYTLKAKPMDGVKN